MNDTAEGRRMTVEIVSWSISPKAWDRVWIKLATPGSAVRNASVARHVSDCATRPGKNIVLVLFANSLDTNQNLKNTGSDLGPNLNLCWLNQDEIKKNQVPAPIFPDSLPLPRPSTPTLSPLPPPYPRSNPNPPPPPPPPRPTPHVREGVVHVFMHYTPP